MGDFSDPIFLLSMLIHKSVAATRSREQDPSLNKSLKPGTHYPCSRPEFTGRECRQAPVYTAREHRCQKRRL